MSRRSPETRPGAEPSVVADRVHSAAVHLLRALRKQDDAAGLSPARLSALSVVVFGGAVMIGQVARAEQVSAPTMTRLLAGMERDGLIQRERDPKDGRVIWIRATAKGARIMQEGRRRRVETLARALSKLPAGQVEQLDKAADIIERVVAGELGRR